MADTVRDRAVEALAERLRTLAPDYKTHRIWGRIEGGAPDTSGNAWAGSPEDVAGEMADALAAAGLLRDEPEHGWEYGWQQNGSGFVVLGMGGHAFVVKQGAELAGEELGMPGRVVRRPIPGPWREVDPDA